MNNFRNWCFNGYNVICESKHFSRWRQNKLCMTTDNTYDTVRLQLTSNNSSMSHSKAGSWAGEANSQLLCVTSSKGNHVYDMLCFFYCIINLNLSWLQGMTSTECSVFTANSKAVPTYHNFAMYTAELVMKLSTCSVAFNGRLTQLAMLTSQWQPNHNEGELLRPKRCQGPGLNRCFVLMEPRCRRCSRWCPYRYFWRMLSEKTPRWRWEIGEVPIVGWDAAALPLRYLGSLCVSPDDVNLSSSRPQRRSLEASGGEHAPAHLQVKIF